VSETLVPAPKRHGRGVKRRNQILEATLRLLAREGASVITHRSVAEEAGVPLAATTYYFESKEQLLAEAFRLHAEKEARRVAKATRVIDAELTKDQLADHLAEFLSDGLSLARANLLAELELMLQAARRPELEPYSRIFYDTIEAQLERSLAAIGSPSPENDTRIILATLAGLEVDNLSTPNSALELARLRQLMHRLLDSLIASEA
jgi:TetR/AcrR family transcriptional regulator, regulator of biofilm formation and stress response